MNSNTNQIKDNQIWFKPEVTASECVIAEFKFNRAISGTGTYLDNVVYTYADSSMSDYMQVTMHIDGGILELGNGSGSSTYTP